MEQPTQESYLRKKSYKQLLDKGQLINKRTETEDLVKTIEDIKYLIVESDRLRKEGRINDRTANSTEVVMDAQVIKISHELIERALEKKGGAEFSDSEYATSIQNFVNCHSDDENWNLIGELCAQFVKSAAPSLCLLGTFESQPVIIEKIQKERVKRNKTMMDEKRPEQLKRVEAEEKGAQKVNIVMTKILEAFKKTQRPLPYYPVVIDPFNFMNTVDNVFQIAFLVKDGSVSLEVGAEGMPAVRPIGREEKERNRDSQLKKQTITTISPAFCQTMVDKYQITTPFLNYERCEPLTQKMSQG